MKEFANKNFAKGAGTKAMNALSEDGDALVIEYGPEPVDPANPDGKYLVEFVVSKPLEAFSPEDQAILADHKVTLDTTRGQGAPQPQEAPPVDTQSQPQLGPSLGDDEQRDQEAVRQDQAPAQPQDGSNPAPAGQDPNPVLKDAAGNVTNGQTEVAGSAPQAPKGDTGIYGYGEVTEWNGTIHSLPIPKGAGRKFLPVRNGVAYPATYTQTRELWDTFDAVSKEKGRLAMLFEVRSALMLKGYSENAISTQYARWCEFWGYDAEYRAKVRAEHGIKNTRTPAEPQTEAERQLAELKAREKAAKKEAARLEREETARLKRIEREAERAAKRRDELEARRLAQLHNSEEWQKQREANVAGNSAVQQERIAREIAERQAALEKAEAELAERKAEIERREAEAQKRLQALLTRQAPAEEPEKAPEPQQAPAEVGGNG